MAHGRGWFSAEWLRVPAVRCGVGDVKFWRPVISQSQSQRRLDAYALSGTGVLGPELKLQGAPGRRYPREGPTAEQQRCNRAYSTVYSLKMNPFLKLLCVQCYCSRCRAHE